MSDKNNYDSTADTLLHIKRVNDFILMFCVEMLYRAANHDSTKLKEPEKSAFDRMTPILKTLTYGSPEYKASTAELGVALEHHYKNNSHHPEHYENKINGMNLFDIVEMFFDWKAATERTKGGDIIKSIEYNIERHGLSEQLASVFKNTVKLIEF